MQHKHMLVVHMLVVHMLVVAIACATFSGCAGNANKDGIRSPGKGELTQLRYQLAETLVAKRSYDSAAPYVRALIQRYPKNARLHLLLGIVLREKGVLGAAQHELQLARKLAPDDADTAAALAILWAKKRNLPRAEKEHRKAIEMSPKVARYHNDLGVCLLTQRKLVEAKEVLEEALRLNPGMRRAFNNLGFVLGLMDKDADALSAFAQAGSRAMALTNMGVVSEMRGRPLRAKHYYERALRQRRGFSPALHNLRALNPEREADYPDPVAQHMPPPKAAPKPQKKAANMSGTVFVPAAEKTKSKQE